eukprot:7061053-Lingulodinium_polyedra.AAC.1
MEACPVKTEEPAPGLPDILMAAKEEPLESRLQEAQAALDAALERRAKLTREHHWLQEHAVRVATK